jgi:hypothetical protein
MLPVPAAQRPRWLDGRPRCLELGVEQAVVSPAATSLPENVRCEVPVYRGNPTWFDVHFFAVRAGRFHWRRLTTGKQMFSDNSVERHGYSDPIPACSLVALCESREVMNTYILS